MNYPKVKFIKKIEENSNEIEIKEKDLINNILDTIELCVPRNEGPFKNKGYWLNPQYDWVIIRDASTDLVLVPLKK